MNHRKTKIICTIGPATSGVDNLVRLIRAGMDTARLNFSHGSSELHKQTIEHIREASRITGRDIAILQDLQGPKIRVGKFPNGSVKINEDDEFIITSEQIEYGNEKIVSTSYENLVKDVKPGKILLLDDGYITLMVEKVIGQQIFTRIIKGGVLKDKKGIIAPGVEISANAISEKDIEDLQFGLECGVDLVALSFVRSERDIIELRTAMKVFKRSVPVIAKIERLEGYSDINDIVNEADGIMVARGDLGLEMPPEEVPLLQKEIIALCNQYGKPVITATQMLESMISNPRPTRAEASDVANAVIDGTDCVMLSGETSVGQYPFDTVAFMDRIIKSVESKAGLQPKTATFPGSSVNDALGRASCVISAQINAKAIVAVTRSGYTALNISKYRPNRPIIAITDKMETSRYLNISWGVYPFVIPPDQSLHQIFDAPEDFIRSTGMIGDGDVIVLVSGLSEGKLKSRNMIKIIEF